MNGGCARLPSGARSWQSTRRSESRLVTAYSTVSRDSRAAVAASCGPRAAELGGLRVILVTAVPTSSAAVCAEGAHRLGRPLGAQRVCRGHALAGCRSGGHRLFARPGQRVFSRDSTDPYRLDAALRHYPRCEAAAAGAGVKVGQCSGTRRARAAECSQAFDGSPVTLPVLRCQHSGARTGPTRTQLIRADFAMRKHAPQGRTGRSDVKGPV